MAHTDRLTDKPYWEDRVGSHSGTLAFDTRSPNFRDLDDLLRKYLPAGENLTFLEVGSYPGRYLWYFNHYFDYQVAGIEYVESCCTEMQLLLKHHRIDAELINEDFFEFQPAGFRKWDIVASFGFVEHFADFEAPIRRHCNLVADDGYVAISIPNHTGFGGWIMKHVNPNGYRAHNQMSYAQLERAVLDSPDMKLVAGGYLGRIGFWNTGLYAQLEGLPKPIGFVLKAGLRLLEKMGRFMPNSRVFSPNAVIVARKLRAAAETSQT